MKCEKCGAELMENMNFCDLCGAPQNRPTVKPIPSVTPMPPVTPMPSVTPRSDDAASPAGTEPSAKGAGAALALSIVSLCMYCGLWLFNTIRHYCLVYENIRAKYSFGGILRYGPSSHAKEFAEYFFSKNNLIHLLSSVSYLACYLCLFIAVIIIAGKLRKEKR